MCTGLEGLLLTAGQAASAIGAVGSLLNKPKTPAMPDPAKERAKAEAEATQGANAKLAMQRKAMRENSLLTGAGLGGGSTQPAPAGARKTLGV